MSPVRSRSPAPLRSSVPSSYFVATRLSAFFDLHHKVGNRFAVRHQHLVRHAGWDVHHVAGLEFLPSTAFDRFASNLAGTCCLLLDQAAAGQNRRVAIENEEDVGEVLVQFAAAAVLAIRRAWCSGEDISRVFRWRSRRPLRLIACRCFGTLQQLCRRPVIGFHRLCVAPHGTQSRVPKSKSCQEHFLMARLLRRSGTTQCIETARGIENARSSQRDASLLNPNLPVVSHA